MSHSPVTEVRRIAKQIPNLASDFIPIRPTAMVVFDDFGFVVKEVHGDIFSLLAVLSFHTSHFVFGPSRQLNGSNRSRRHAKIHGEMVRNRRVVGSESLEVMRSRTLNAYMKVTSVLFSTPAWSGQTRRAANLFGGPAIRN